MSFAQSRRQFIKMAGALSAGVLSAAWLAGCAPKATPAPTPEAAPKTEEKPAAQEPAPAGKIELRYMDRGDALGEFMRDFSRIYEERNPNIVVKNESAGWSDLVTKVPTYVAAGTMADIAFQHNTFMMPELSKKGAWLDLSPVADKDGHDFSIYWPWAIDSLKQGPKDELVGMPMGVHNGENEIMWNVEMLQEFGVGEPSEDMTLEDFQNLLVQIQAKMPKPGYAAAFSNGFYGMEAHSRSFGGYIISQDRTKCGLNLPETIKAHQWMIDLIHKDKVVPFRDAILASTKQMFYTATVAVYSNCGANAWVGFAEATEGKFTLGHCMWPHGGGGKVGTTPSCDANVIYGKTKYPDEAWGLVKLLSSAECAKATALSASHMTPGAVIEMWSDPEVVAANPLYGNAAKFWLSMKPEDFGNLPVPANTRRGEFWDLYDNEWAALRDGDRPFDQAAIDKLTADLQAIMDKPLP